MVCMKVLLSSNCRISSNIDNIHLKLSTHIYLKMFFHSIFSQSIKILKIFFHGIITIELL